MNQPNEDKIKITEKQLKLCGRISMAALIVTILLLAAEFVLAGQFKGASWAGNVVKFCTYACYIMPFVIAVPLFVRSNLKVRLHNLKWRQQQEEKAGEDVQ